MPSAPNEMQRETEREPEREPELERLCIDTIRGLAMDAVQKANSGHPGTAMALAPLAYMLWTRYLRVNPKDTAVAGPRPVRALRRARERCCCTACCI